jgi:hypothetical protein
MTGDLQGVAMYCPAMARRRPLVLLLALAALAILVALPVMAASPAPSAGPSASHGPGKPDKGPKANAGHQDADEAPVTLRGTIAATTDAGGETSYTLASGGKTYTLEAGPPWFWGDKHPLKPYVGKTVTVTGEQATGSTDLDVLTVDGKAIREPGRPPWAGGWKRVGASHPGWSKEKADSFKARFGDCFPPGQCKDKPETEASPAP